MLQSEFLGASFRVVGVFRDWAKSTTRMNANYTTKHTNDTKKIEPLLVGMVVQLPAV